MPVIENKNKDEKYFYCSLCLKPKAVGDNKIICYDCADSSIQLLRQSCIENDKINNLLSNEINNLFENIARIKNGQEFKMEPVTSENNDIPIPTSTSMFGLAFQLLKLEVSNLRRRLSNIERTKSILDDRLSELKSQIESKERELSEQKASISEHHQSLLKNYNTARTNINRSIFQFKNEKILQVNRQAISLQYQNYKSMRDIIFGIQPKDFNLIYKLRNNYSSKVLLYNQSILQVSDFFKYNNKLTRINEFLENLIKLQVHLSTIFKHDIPEMPYLKDVVSYLPDSKFYDLVSEKEKMLHDFEEEDPAPPENIEQIFISPDSNNGQVLKLSKDIMLPLSSKSINNQLRRASITKTEYANPKYNIDESSRNDRSKASEAKKQSATQEDKQNPSLITRKVVVVPYRILSKPFSKLSSKEFLKFLSIVVKILYNFKTFFQSTLALRASKKSEMGTISATVQLFRKNTSDEIEGSCNFEKIIHDISHMDSFFEGKLDAISSLKFKVRAGNSVSNEDKTKNSPNAFESNDTSVLDFASRSSTENSENCASDSQLDNDYLEVRQENSYVLSPSEAKVYGVFSGTSSYQSTLEKDSQSPSNISIQQQELRSIMNNTYKLMLTGTSHIQTESEQSRKKNFDSKAIGMMMKSRTQLEDWDIVSKMY